MAQQHDPAASLPQALEVRRRRSARRRVRAAPLTRAAPQALYRNPDADVRQKANWRVAAPREHRRPDRARALTWPCAASRRWLPEFQVSQEAWQARKGCRCRFLGAMPCRVRER